MHVISLNQVAGVLEHIMFGLNEVPIFVGQFGGGKTAGVDQFVKSKNAYMCKVLLGQYDTVDLRGTPWTQAFTSHEDDADPVRLTVWHPASTLPFKGNPKFPTDRPIVLFLDELTSATVPVMGICYQLINERRIGEHELMDNVYICCAGNREIDKGIVTRMPMPLCNRMIWFEVGVDVESLCDHAQAQGWAPEFIAFMHFRKPLICTYDPGKADKVVATPRTWEKAMKVYALEMPHDIKLAAMAGAVGEGPSAEFWGFVKSWHKIAAMMPSIMKDPVKAEVPTEPGMCYALSVALSGALTEKTARTILTYMTKPGGMEPEFNVLSWQLALKRDNKLFGIPEFVEFGKKYRAVFQ